MTPVESLRKEANSLTQPERKVFVRQGWKMNQKKQAGAKAGKNLYSELGNLRVITKLWETHERFKSAVIKSDESLVKIILETIWREDRRNSR